MPWRRIWQATSVFLLENPMDRRAWWATVHSITNSWTWPRWLSTHMHSGCSGPDHTGIQLPQTLLSLQDRWLSSTLFPLTAASSSPGLSSLTTCAASWLPPSTALAYELVFLHQTVSSRRAEISCFSFPGIPSASTAPSTTQQHLIHVWWTKAQM